MKKIFSVLLAVAVFMSFTVVYAETGVSSTDYTKTYEKMSKLGLLSNEIDYTDENAQVKRVDFIIAALKLIKFDTNSNVTDDLFSDVDKDYYAAGYIKKGVSLGFLSGYSDGTFRPENTIALNQAVKIVVKMLGYSEIAEASGGYPNGYLTVAYDKNILKGVTVDGDGLTYKNMLKLFENVIETDIMSLEMNGETVTFEEKEDENILSAYHDIYFDKGIVNANDVTALMNYSETSDGKVNINGTEYFSSNSGIDKKLGYATEFYYKKADDDITGTVLYFEESDKNYKTVVNYEDIVKTNSAYSFTYYDERDRKETVEVTADTNVIVNGKIKPFYDKEDLTPDYGEVTLIDNNDDNVIDVIDIFKVTDTIVVNNSSLRDGKVSISDMLDSTKVLAFDEEDEYLLIKEGTEILPTDLVQWNIILVGRSQEGYLKMVVSDDELSGRVSSINEGDKAIIDGAEYNISPNYIQLSEKIISVNKIKTGMSATFYLDYFGSIAAVPETEGDTVHYGFVFKVYEDESIDNKIFIKLLSDENKIQTFETTEKIKLNGMNVEGNIVKSTLEKTNSDDEGRKQEGVRQIISYILNDEGIIKAINTVGATEELRYEGSFTSDYYYDFYLGTYGREFWEYEKTKTFCIYEAEEQCQVVANYSSVLSEQNKDYTMYFYNKDEALQVDVALRYFEGEATSKSAAISADNLIVMAEKVTYGLDEDENEVRIVEAVDVKGNKHSVHVSDTSNSYVENMFNSIIPGDVFIYTTSNVGKLTGITKIFDSTRYTEYGSQGQDSCAKGESVHGRLEYGTIHSTRANIYARVKYVSDKNLIYEVEEGEERMIRLASSPVAIMDISNPKNIEITTGASVSDILPGNNILVSAKWNTVNGAIVIITK